VYWAGASLPPSVFVGQRVNFVGRLVTYDGGTRFKVVEAVPFIENYRKAINPVIDYLWTILEDPREWAKPYTLDFLRLKDYKEEHMS
jgi:hypothetical protein